MNTINLKAIVAVFLSLTSVFASALTLNNQLAAHTHGIAELNIEMESQVIQIHFTSPAADIICFEHKAKDDVEIQRVKQAETTLKNAKALFNFQGAHCSIQDKHVDLSAMYWNRNHHGHGHRHQHAEVNAYYEFLCTGKTKTIRLDVNLFNSFPSLNEIKAYWLTENKHGTTKLTSKNNKVLLP